MLLHSAKESELAEKIMDDLQYIEESDYWLLLVEDA
jgi:hypothetical protein